MKCHPTHSNMDNKLNAAIDYVKKNIVSKIKEMEMTESEKTTDLIQYILDMNIDDMIFEEKPLPPLSSKPSHKKKRSKSAMSTQDRCHAKNINGTQCTRKKQAESEFCAMHTKSTPHGTMNEEELETIEKRNVEINGTQIYAQTIMGIVYYVDSNENVYSTEDILNAVPEPRIVKKGARTPP